MATAAVEVIAIVILKIHHHANKLGNVLNEGLYPFPVGFRVDCTVGCTVGCTNNCTPRALLWVYLHKIEGPKQLLQAASQWTEPVSNEELPESVDFLTLIWKNSRMSRSSVFTDRTPPGARFWMSQAISSKSGSASFGPIESTDSSSSSTMRNSVVLFMAENDAERGTKVFCCVVIPK